VTDTKALHALVRQAFHGECLAQASAGSGQRRPASRLPPWLGAGVIGVIVVLLGALYAWAEVSLWRKDYAAARRTEMAGVVTQSAPTRLYLKALLQEEMARGLVTVHAGGARSTVVFRGDDMFASGEAGIGRKMLPALDKLAGALSLATGMVLVIGHTDSDPITSAPFASNQELSEKRAAAVSEYLAGKGVARSRLEYVGKGDSEPLTNNATAKARAANRRVEIVLMR